MGTQQQPPPDVIDLVPVDIGGKTVYVDPQLVGDPIITTPNGNVTVTNPAGEQRLVSELPTERFAGKPTKQKDEWSTIMDSIRAAETGQSHLPVLATPAGTIAVRGASGEERVVAQLPKERFAAPLATERAEVARLDPAGRHWRHSSALPQYRLGDPLGWIVELQNNFADAYVFFVPSEPAGLYQAQLVAPAALDLPGHSTHMIMNGVVCLNERFGVPDLTAMHGALAKWMFYSGSLRRGVKPAFSQ